MQGIISWLINYKDRFGVVIFLYHIEHIVHNRAHSYVSYVFYMTYVVKKKLIFDQLLFQLLEGYIFCLRDFGKHPHKLQYHHETKKSKDRPGIIPEYPMIFIQENRRDKGDKCSKNPVRACTEWLAGCPYIIGKYFCDEDPYNCTLSDRMRCYEEQ